VILWLIIPAEAGIQLSLAVLKELDSGLRRNDELAARKLDPVLAE